MSKNGCFKKKEGVPDFSPPHLFQKGESDWKVENLTRHQMYIVHVKKKSVYFPK